MRRAAPALAAAVALAIGCGPETIALPEPPMEAETAQLVALYDMPTATLDTSNIDQTRSDAQARLDELNLDWFPGVVADLLTALRSRLDSAGLPEDPAARPKADRATLTAVIDLHRACAGWDDPAGAPDEATNGALHLTAIVDTGTLNPETWGTASACRVRFPRVGIGGDAIVVNRTVVKATLDGTLIIYLLAPVPPDAADAQFLVSFNGAITIDDQTHSVSFDFEVVKRSVRFRVPVDGGDAIVTVGSTLGIQGANAGFSCDLTTLRCQSTS